MKSQLRLRSSLNEDFRLLIADFRSSAINNSKSAILNSIGNLAKIHSNRWSGSSDCRARSSEKVEEPSLWADSPAAQSAGIQSSRPERSLANIEFTKVFYQSKVLRDFTEDWIHTSIRDTKYHRCKQTPPENAVQHRHRKPTHKC